MTRICVTAGNADEIRRFREAGADEIVLAPEGCAMSALPEFSTEEIAGQGTVSLLMNRLFMPEMLAKAEAVLDTGFKHLGKHRKSIQRIISNVIKLRHWVNGGLKRFQQMIC